MQNDQNELVWLMASIQILQTYLLPRFVFDFSTISQQWPISYLFEETTEIEEKKVRIYLRQYNLLFYDQRKKTEYSTHTQIHTLLDIFSNIGSKQKVLCTLAKRSMSNWLLNILFSIVLKKTPCDIVAKASVWCHQICDSIIIKKTTCSQFFRHIFFL